MTKRNLFNQNEKNGIFEPHNVDATKNHRQIIIKSDG